MPTGISSCGQTPDSTPVRCRHCRQRLKRDDLNDEIRKLESVLYTSDGEQDWRGADLLKLVEELRGQKDESVSRRNLLSELNPH